MFAVIYRFKLKPHQETEYRACWRILVDYFLAERGAIGSCLHKGPDGLWVAYSRWPDKATRDASWPGDAAASEDLPANIREVIQIMQAIKEENKEFESEEICLELVEDKLL